MVKKVNFMLCASRPYILTIGNGCKGKRESQKIILIQATGRTKGTNKKEKEKNKKTKPVKSQKRAPFGKRTLHSGEVWKLTHWPNNNNQREGEIPGYIIIPICPSHNYLA